MLSEETLSEMIDHAHHPESPPSQYKIFWLMLPLGKQKFEK